MLVTKAYSKLLSNREQKLALLRVVAREVARDDPSCVVATRHLRRVPHAALCLSVFHGICDLIKEPRSCAAVNRDSALIGVRDLCALAIRREAIEQDRDARLFETWRGRAVGFE